MTAPDPLAGRRVAVAGASGLLGSHLVEQLAARGALLRVSRHRSPLAMTDESWEVVAGDLREPAAAAALVAGVERLYICTGVVGGAGMIGHSVQQVTQTLTTAVQLLEAAALAGVPKVGLVSSATVYPLASHPLREEDAFSGEPFDGYFGAAWTNRALEKVAEYLVRSGALRVAIIRPSSIYGPRDRFGPGAHVIPGLIMRALAGEDPFTIWGDGTAIRDFVHVTDVARALIDATEQATDAQPLNIGSGEPVSIAELVSTVLDAVGHTPRQRLFDLSQPTTIPVRRLCIDQARRTLGFSPRIGLAEGLLDTVRWYRNHRPDPAGGVTANPPNS